VSDRSAEPAPSEPEENGGALEHHLEVTRTGRYWTLGDPEGAHDEVWVVLHGYGQLARRFVRRFTAMASASRLIVAPEGLSRFYIGSGEGRHGPGAMVGATWMTREDREAEIRDYVAWLDRLAAAVVRSAPRLTVLGFSQGVATAWRWITYGRAPGLVRLVAWAGELPPDLDVARAARAMGEAEVLLVSGEGDRTVRPEIGARDAERLDAAGISYRSLRHPGGHEIHEQTLLDIAR
jgi:predicted esterase